MDMEADNEITRRQSSMVEPRYARDTALISNNGHQRVVGPPSFAVNQIRSRTPRHTAQHGCVPVTRNDRWCPERNRCWLERQRQAVERERWFGRGRPSGPYECPNGHLQPSVSIVGHNTTPVFAPAAYRHAAAATLAAAAATASSLFYPSAYAGMAVSSAPATAHVTPSVIGPPLYLLLPGSHQQAASDHHQPSGVSVLASQQPTSNAVTNGPGTMAVMWSHPASLVNPVPFIFFDGQFPYGYQHYHPDYQMIPNPFAQDEGDWMQVDHHRGATLELINQCSNLRCYQRPKDVTVYGNLEVCCICLSEFQRNENVRLLVCSHFFHVACIDRWLMCDKRCPICRVSIDRDFQ